MEENKDKGLFIRELKERLDWYTLQASDEEYDEKAVESILYLLDSMDPIEEEEIPRQNEAWERFKELAAGQEGEILPLTEMGDAGTPDGERETSGRAGTKRTASDAKYSARKKLMVHMGHFVMCHKYIAAAILILVIFAVGNTARAIATGDPGFFYWLKQDDTGTTMMTSPEGLEAVTDMSKHTYLNREEMPEWTQNWLEIEEKFEMPKGYELQYFETSEAEYRQYVDGNYLNEREEKEIILGAWVYQDILSYHEEGFIDYIYVGSFEIDQQQMKIYSKTEESGIIFYIICFYNKNSKYFIQGQDNLEEVKALAVKYWNCIKKN